MAMVHPANKTVRACRVVSVAAQHYGLHEDDVTAQSRYRQHVLARQCAAWLLRAAYGFSLADTARLLSQDPATIVYSLERVVDRAYRDREFKAVLVKLACRLLAQEVAA